VTYLAPIKLSFLEKPCKFRILGVSLGLTLKELTMAHSNSVQFQALPAFSFKPLLTIKDFFILLVTAFIEAKEMEQQTRKTSGNW
jgi:hypothetical protein